jgi:hypothetical protein
LPDDHDVVLAVSLMPAGSSHAQVETLFGKRRVKQIAAGLNQTWAISGAY